MLKNVIIFPVGSQEYHGRLLPPETDALIASRVALDLSQKFKKSRLLPVLSYGISNEHSDFDTTVTADTESYISFMLRLLDSISAENSLIVILNGHGGNASAISAIESDYNYRHGKSKIFAPQLYNRNIKTLCENLLGEFDAHAGSVESSLLAYYGSIKEKDLVEFDDSYIKKMNGSLRFFRTAQVSKSGIIKDTNKMFVSAEHGETIHNSIIEQLYKEIDDIKKSINNILG